MVQMPRTLSWLVLGTVVVAGSVLSFEIWKRALDAVTAAARDGSNLMPPIIDAVEAHATVGEISDAMRTVFGMHQEASTV